jgi:hypothetical protein
MKAAMDAGLYDQGSPPHSNLSFCLKGIGSPDGYFFAGLVNHSRSWFLNF